MVISFPSPETSQILRYIKDVEHPKIQPASAREKGIVWVPVNVNLIVKHHLGGRVLWMTKQDGLFEDCKCKLHKRSMQRYFVANSMLFNQPLKENLKNQRSRVSDLATITQSYQS